MTAADAARPPLERAGKRLYHVERAPGIGGPFFTSVAAAARYVAEALRCGVDVHVRIENLD